MASPDWSVDGFFCRMDFEAGVRVVRWYAQLPDVSDEVVGGELGFLTAGRTRPGGGEVVLVDRVPSVALDGYFVEMAQFLRWFRSVWLAEFVPAGVCAFEWLRDRFVLWLRMEGLEHGSEDQSGSRGARSLLVSG